MRKTAVGAGILAAGLVLAAAADWLALRTSEPGPEYYPAPGRTFESRAEGFRQTILGYRGDLAWTELVIEPHAPGPPEHVHTTFHEHFVVAEGTLSLMVNGEKRILRAGESFLVRPGVPHKPFNETGARVVIRGPLTPQHALPKRFVVFLTQAYPFFDEAESNARPPAALLQMSRFSPVYDVWLAGPPVALQRAAFAAIGPFARLLGYRAYYDPPASSAISRAK